MNYFTKEQIEEIQTLDGGKMEYHFACVVQSKFKRGTPSTADSRLYALYKDATGEQLTQNGCKTCQFNNYNKIARLYYDSKKYWEDLEEKKAGDEIVELVTDLKALETPKKTTNKRKTTKKK